VRSAAAEAAGVVVRAAERDDNPLSAVGVEEHRVDRQLGPRGFGPALDTPVPISIATLEHHDGRLASGFPNRGVVNGGLSQLGCFAGNTSCG
jgi:hypothetical protein